MTTDIIDSIITGFKEVFKSNLILGERIKISDSLELIPVYRLKMSYLIVDGMKSANSNGTNMNVTPLCLIVIKNEEVRILPFGKENNSEKILEKVPSILDGLSGLFNMTFDEKDFKQ